MVPETLVTITMYKEIANRGPFFAAHSPEWNDYWLREARSKGLYLYDVLDRNGDRVLSQIGDEEYIVAFVNKMNEDCALWLLQNG